MFINDPDQRSVPMPSVLQMLFGLTPSEARVALHIAEGQDLRGVCDEFSITYATARAHLRSIFQKTGVRRQAELSSLVLPLGSPRSDGSDRSRIILLLSPFGRCATSRAGTGFVRQGFHIFLTMRSLCGRMTRAPQTDKSSQTQTRLNQ